MVQNNSIKYLTISFSHLGNLGPSCTCVVIPKQEWVVSNAWRSADWLFAVRRVYRMGEAHELFEDLDCVSQSLSQRLECLLIIIINSLYSIKLAI
jgi:hypothetical protein